MNAMLLKEEGYKRKVNECILNKGRMDVEDVGVWWEELKSEIKKMSIEYSRSRNKKERGRGKKREGGTG